MAASALLQATSIGFLVVATEIGREMGLISAANGAAVIAAGLLSVVVFPFGALALLRGFRAAGGTVIESAPQIAGESRAIASVHHHPNPVEVTR